jgi:hypothetical protein
VGRTLTVFILHCGDERRHNPEKTARSVVNPLTTTITIVPPGFRDLNTLHAYSDWKMFLFSDEWLSEQLVKVLPIYLEQEDFNVLSTYRMVELENDRRYKVDDLRVSISPRLFKSDIQLKDFSFQWSSDQDIVITHSIILDGFVIGASIC